MRVCVSALSPASPSTWQLYRPPSEVETRRMSKEPLLKADWRSFVGKLSTEAKGGKVE